MTREPIPLAVAVVFHRLGPYHCARLEAAARVCRIAAIELSAEDSDYAWDKVWKHGTFLRRTLFESGDIRQASLAALNQKITATFEELSPKAVAIPGWSDKGAIASLNWCLHHRVPAIVMSESTALDEARSGWKEWIKKRLVGLCSSALVGGTPHVDYLAQLGMPRDRIFLGYDAVDNDYFARGAEEVRGQRSEVRDRYGLPERYFLASARFIEKKNLPGLVQAYGRYRNLCEKSEVGSQKSEISIDTSPSVPLPDRGGEGSRQSEVQIQNSEFRIQNSAKPWSLVLLGDGPLKADLCSLISDLRLQHSVLLPGFKQYLDLPAYYGLASVFIHASTVEQWGLVVNEAMASGLPVLVSNRCGCAPDLVQEGVNGFTFAPENVKHLAQLMLRLGSTLPAQRSELGVASHRLIANWGPDRFASGLKQAVECALQVAPRHASWLDRMLLKALLVR